MRIGIFADAHDHVDNVRIAIAEFNRLGCDLVLFAGDFVSPIVVPPFRKLTCPVISCFGDNEGNRIGIEGGMRIIGSVGFPPFGVITRDGTRIILTHSIDSLKGLTNECEVVVSAHTHRAAIVKDANGRLFINPGETSGWTYRKPSIAVLETKPLSAEIVWLPAMPPVAV